MKKFLIVLAVLLIPMLWVGASSAGEENLNGQWDAYWLWSPGSPSNATWTVSGTSLTSTTGATGQIYDADPYVAIVFPSGCAPVYLGWSFTDKRMGGNGICTDGSASEVAWMAAKHGTEDDSASGAGTEDSP